eukprot:gnl/TRDRNA2_/TRDRNA2_203706_c0_seq1.p1 gnl/TRDRNA2_/TRDRNA2_203706_c0~~gnl/TRDRNA2_/TRDRNA2_203706_c0_seq1.p1  ORF type:complete len:385 (-),score=57.15 gnl/TRDRNA2_/TRDRNA2_203706_c0_seq1:126-1280(-)
MAPIEDTKFRQDETVASITKGLAAPAWTAPVSPSLQAVLSSRRSLEAFIEENIKVESWDPPRYDFVQKIQEAPMNQGEVDLMCEKGCSTSRFAVKLMPNSWVTNGPKEFAEKRPHSHENPWFDIGIVKALNTVQTPFVCDIHGVFANCSHTYVVTSFANKGDLFTLCNQETFALKPPGPEREEWMKPLVVQLFVAFRRLHALGIAHRDISLENILLTVDGSGQLQIQVIDFGMSTMHRMCSDGVRGKRSYQAPEMHREVVYDAFLADAFALGVVLYGIAVADYPWISTKPGCCQLFEFISKFGLEQFLGRRKLRDDKRKTTLAKVLSPAFVAMISGLLHFDPSKRMSLGESCYGTGSLCSRTSVWQTEWLNGSEALPDDIGAGA